MTFHSIGRAGRKLLLVTGSVVFFIGLALTFAWHLVDTPEGSKLFGREFPLSNDLCLTVDSLCRIYTGDNFYQRIQRYS